VVVEVLCTPGQQEGLVELVDAAVRRVAHAGRLRNGHWHTGGVRLRMPRSADERVWLFEAGTQPDDPLAADREAMVLEIGGRGSQAAAAEVLEAVGHALCPDDFHPGPCPIPWSIGQWSLRTATREEKDRYRGLFPRHRGGTVDR